MQPLNVSQGTVLPDGAAVRRLRLAQGWSQEQLAARAGLSGRSMESIETGKVRVRITNLQLVADAFGVPLAELVAEAVRAEFNATAAPGRSSLPAQPTAAVLPFRPQQLPLYLTDFIGREDERNCMTDHLLGKPGSTVHLSAVNGMGGVGKTSLAVQVGHDIKDKFPGGQLFLDLKGMHDEPITPARAMAILFQSLRPEARVPPDPDLLTAEYRSALAAAGQVLVVLDNAAGAEQVRSLLPAPPGCGIVTSRHTLSLSEFGVLPILLDVLSPPEATAMLRQILGQRGTDTQLTKIVTLCGFLPLAVRVAGDFLRGRPDYALPEYADALRTEALRWLKADKDRDVEVVLRLSAAQLVRESLERATRWALLAGFDSSFDRHMAADTWETEPDDASVQYDLSDLVARSMLVYDAKADTYQMHDLMRPIAAGLFAKP